MTEFTVEDAARGERSVEERMTEKRERMSRSPNNTLESLGLDAELLASRKREEESARQLKQLQAQLLRQAREIEVDKASVLKKSDATAARAAKALEEERAKAAKTLDEERRRGAVPLSVVEPKEGK